jgi:hypothetical protein
MIKPSKDFNEALYGLYLEVATPEELEADSIEHETRFSILEHLIDVERTASGLPSCDILKIVYKKYEKELDSLNLHLHKWSYFN